MSHSLVLSTLLCFGLSTAPAADIRRDLFGDPLPSAAVARLGTTRLWHGATVRSVALSPDGKVLATGAGTLRGRFNQLRWEYPADRTVRLLDTATGTERRRFPAPANTVVALCFSPDGKLLAGLCGGLVCIWDSVTARELCRFEVSKESEGSVQFSADGKQLHHIDPTGSVDSWELAGAGRHRRWQAPPQPEGQFNNCVSAALSPDGQVVAWLLTRPKGDYATRLSVHDTTTGQKLYEQAFVRPLGQIGFSADSKLIAVSMAYYVIVLLEARTGKQVHKIDSAGPTRSVVFTPDGTKVASVLDTGGVRFWDTNSGKPLYKLAHQGVGDHLYQVWIRPLSPSRCSFSADGRMAAVACGAAVLLWDVPSQTPRPGWPGHRDAVQRMSFAAGGKQLLSGADVLCTWDSADWGQQARAPALEGWECSAMWRCFSPEGHSYVERDKDGYLSVKHAGTDKEVRRPRGRQVMPPGDVDNFAFSGDGRRVSALILKNRRWLAEVHDIASGKTVRRVKLKDEAHAALKIERDPEKKHLWRLSASGDGKMLAWHTRQGEILIADVDAQVIRRLSPPSDEPQSEEICMQLVFSPDGRYLASALHSGDLKSTDAAIHVWEVATRREALRMDLRQVDGQPAIVSSLAFSPGGHLLAVGRYDDDLVHLFEVASGLERYVFTGHSSAANCFAFAPDGSVLASGSSDTTILIWDMVGALTSARKAPPRADELEVFWADLASTNGRKAEQAVRELSRSPAEAVPFLAARLAPAKAAEPSQLAQLVTDLRDSRFLVRERAVAALQQWHVQAEPTLREALDRTPDEELRRRLQRLLEKSQGPIMLPMLLRDLRAVEVLEKANITAARTILEDLAGGSASARLTSEARAALRRLVR